MFTLRTAKGRLASSALVLLAFTMAACPGEEVDPPAPVTDEEPQDPPEDQSDTNDADTTETDTDESTDDEVVDEAEASAEEVIAEAEAAYESCHEANSAGGASDGVLFFELSAPAIDILSGVTVEIDVETGDGSVVTVPGTLGDDGIVFLIPLSSFGEVITIVDVRVNGVSVAMGLVGTQYTVDPESSCENHPEVA